jgi:hypothetical protein
MATLHVRNVPDSLYEDLRGRADANGRSIGAEAIQLLERQLASELSRRPRWLTGPRRRPGGLFTRFTERGRSVVVAAQEEARALSHDHVGTGHLLLGLLRTEESRAAAALQTLGLDLEAARAHLERLLPRGETEPAGQIPFSPAAKKALELALRESLAAHCDYIGTEHVLLGIVREGESEGAQLVAAVEPDAGKVRACALRAVVQQEAYSFLPGVPSFRVVELGPDAAAWERTLNDAAARGYDLVEIREGRAILRRPE